MPFLAAIKPPVGFESVEAALPKGFQERVQGRGFVHGGWVQQPLILAHPSVGCFITHCGPYSLVDALLSKCQLVMIPNYIDQVVNARFIGNSLKAGVEVEKGEEDGLFTKESVCKAVKLVMDGESEIGREVRANLSKLRSILLTPNLESTYIDSFSHKLQDLLNSSFIEIPVFVDKRWSPTTEVARDIDMNVSLILKALSLKSLFLLIRAFQSSWQTEGRERKGIFPVEFTLIPAMAATSFHIAMFPWFAMGHLIPFLQLSNKLAKKGHKISFFIPKGTQAKLEHFNLCPDLITFVPITVPQVDGLPLPHAAETTADLHPSLFPHLMTAFDRTEKEIELLLIQLRPKVVFFDFAYWLPNMARRLGIKSLQYHIITPPSAAHDMHELNEFDLMQPSSDFPDSSIKLHSHEARAFAAIKKMEFGSGVLFFDRIFTGQRSCDAIGFKGCREIEGSYVDYLESQIGKPVLLVGPLLPEQSSSSTLEEKWASWLGGFRENSIIYCSFGSECILQLNQFQELVLGLELSGTPFLAAIKPPVGFESVEAALPKGFQERVQGRGIVHGGWVQQPLILAHPSVGCFITHCGPYSLVDALLSKCQLVMIPNYIDQVVNARFIGNSLKAGVEVEKGEEDGLFTKESVCKAVKLVMDGESEIGREVRANLSKLRSILLTPNLESIYIDSFSHKLQDLLNR
ncbi:hypothetical protein L6164_035465 [Bauhinia variegata]|uniref:Uncharacterized protein n=1 Tax=Bauhinia variegata TaxID=167791 RepID=A0ACB9KE14_BAUVA|nr:hypothetical protein L6164_035465 [Bauhinia variegata]